MMSPTKYESLLIYCSYFDIIYSAGLIIIVGLHVATCRVEDETVINHNTSLEQMEFFYNALEDCGFKEESQIPSTDTVCTNLENQVMPFAGSSLALNFVLGVFIQIMIRDSQFFLDKEFNKYSQPVSLISVPVGTFFSMSLGSIALAEYTKPEMCWLSYSINEQGRTYAFLVAVILVPIILIVYKPMELAIFYLYGGTLFSDDYQQNNKIIHVNRDSQMSEEPNIRVNRDSQYSQMSQEPNENK